MFVRQKADTERAFALKARGWDNRFIAADLGVHPRTVSRWLKAGPTLPERRRPRTGDELVEPGMEPDYAYLLGLYLGDGHIARVGRTQRLRITLDASYPKIVDSAAASMQVVRPNNLVAVVALAPVCAVNVQCYSNVWNELFPQHGPGCKHERAIWLAEWQRSITSRHPRELIKGLIHSDGCRFVANQTAPSGKVYRYARYAFSNESADILEILAAHLEEIGAGYTYNRHNGIQIARRDSVELLDAFIGPKCLPPEGHGTAPSSLESASFQQFRSA